MKAIPIVRQQSTKNNNNNQPTNAAQLFDGSKLKQVSNKQSVINGLSAVAHGKTV